MKQIWKSTLALAGLMMAMMAGTAQAGLVNLSSPMWPPPGSSGLETVQFRAVSGPMGGASAATVALGAHAYKNGPLLPNDNNSVFFANSGTYAAEDRANWSFDFAVDPGSCTGCIVQLFMDVDPGMSQDFRSFAASAVTVAGGDSWRQRSVLSIRTLQASTTSVW